jgi:restriction system protein
LLNNSSAPNIKRQRHRRFCKQLVYNGSLHCIHIAKYPNQQQYRVTPKSTGITHVFCFSCYEIYKTNPRKNPWESISYNVYRSSKPGLLKDQWVKISDTPIPPTDSGKVQYHVQNAVPDGSEYYVTSINAVGLESNPGKVILKLPDDAPKLVLKSVVLFGETTDEGKIVEAVTLPWFEILELLKNNSDAAFQIPPDKWEEVIAGAYRRSGFDEVILTPRSGDYGRDVIATKKGIGTVRVIDQVKAYKPGHLVTANDARALLGVLQGDGASKGFLTTTSDFAPKLSSDPLLEPFMPSRIELINGEKLLKRLFELSLKKVS